MEHDDASCAGCAALRQQLDGKDHEIAALRAKLAEVTRHDDATGALNEKGLLEQIELELIRARRTGHPLCFAMLAVGIAGGAPVPPEALRTAAAISMRTLRALDHFGRLRNAGFGILLPSTWPDQALIATDRLKAAFRAQDWTALAPGATLRFVFGMTTQGPTDTPALLIKRAASALAQATRQDGDALVQLEAPLPGL
ncbi:MAG: GGDEF domain-containing protein [Burkholderiaceae bacterium]